MAGVGETEPGGAAGDPLGEVAAATLEGFMAGLAAADSGLWDMRSTNPSRRGGVVLVRGIMMAVGRIIRTLGTTGITVHLITGSMTMPARTMTIATPSMCSRHRVM